jgi:hypothetical protein
MSEDLFARALRAIEASRALQEQHRLAKDQQNHVVRELRRNVLKSAMLRSEVQACRDDREE